MPVMDGFATAVAIRESGESYEAIPLIALTASCYPEDIERCRESGFTDIVNKPIRKKHLAKLIDQFASSGVESTDGT